jgi:hypothetical protein
MCIIYDYRTVIIATTTTTTPTTTTPTTTTIPVVMVILINVRFAVLAPFCYMFTLLKCLLSFIV